MDLFFDSSALVKRYVNETGSTWVAATVDKTSGNNVFVVEITAVELKAAIARRTRGSSAVIVDAVFANLQHDLDYDYFVSEITATLLQTAGILARQHFLRGYDAVQLAAATNLNREQTAFGLPPITLVSADDELLVAAQTEGLLVENPNNYP